MFFVWDDFIWLERARTFTANPMQVFTCDVSYFDPLVHIFFWLLYTIGGKIPWVYHLAAISIHCINAALVWLLYRETGGSRPAAISAALFFATTFTAADAVLWPSSAVDLLAVLFSLLSLINYTRHISGAGRVQLVLSFFFFSCALASKGTPVVLPAILAVMLLSQGRLRKKWMSLIPYVILSGGYLLAVRIMTEGAFTGAAGGENYFNIRNFLSGMASLASPERYLAGTGLPVTVATVAATLLVVIIIWRGGNNARATTALGISVAVFATAPLLLLHDLTFVAPSMQAKFLLNSPSHRLYLATVGSALLAGSAVEWALIQASRHRWQVGYYVAVSLVLVLLWNNHETGKRYGLWRIVAENIRQEVESLAPSGDDLRPNGVIALAGFSMSRGFLQPMLSTWYGATNMTILPIDTLPEDIPDEPALLAQRDNSSLFIRKNSTTFNRSTDFRDLLGTALQYQLSGTSVASDEASRKYLLQVRQINSFITQK